MAIVRKYFPYMLRATFDADGEVERIELCFREDAWFDNDLFAAKKYWGVVKPQDHALALALLAKVQEELE